MSTRCQIGFYQSKGQKTAKPDALIYRHTNGYPDGILPDIIPTLKEAKEKRGLEDTEYTSAWLLHDLIEDHIKAMEDLTQEEGRDFLVYGISKDFHGDIEYFYKVYPNAVEVYRTKDRYWQQDFRVAKPKITDYFTKIGKEEL